MAFRWSPYEKTSFCGFCCLEMFSWWAASVPAAYYIVLYGTYLFYYDFRCVLFMDAYGINVFDLHITNRYVWLVFKFFTQCCSQNLILVLTVDVKFLPLFSLFLD
jgi:hypothetical protein